MKKLWDRKPVWFLLTVATVLLLGTGILTLLLLPSVGRAQVVGVECQGVATNIKGVTTGVHFATVDFSGTQPSGQLDPIPLLETQIEVRTSGCVIAHFSAQADPQDNHIVFQVSIDDVPMAGHAQFPYLLPAPVTPVVWDPEETNQNLSRMVAYDFVAQVTRGAHTVRVRWAPCCSASPSTAGFVRAAVLTLQY
jgi:hypothetical protein